MKAPWECIKHKWPYQAWYNENSILEMFEGKREATGVQHIVSMVNFGLNYCWKIPAFFPE